MMKMSIEQVCRVAANLKAVLERKLPTREAVSRATGQVIDPEANDRHAGEEFVAVDADGDRHVVSYRRRTGQTPIMVIVRPAHQKLMITAECPIKGYVVFDETADGDYMQDRTLPGASFNGLLDALTELSKTVAGDGASAPVATGCIRETPLSFDLLCAVCGETASRFKRGLYPGDDHLVYFDGGGQQRWMFSGRDSEDMTPYLAAGDLAGLQTYVRENVPFRPILPVYCPTCNAAYCDAHRQGPACPKGHPWPPSD